MVWEKFFNGSSKRRTVVFVGQVSHFVDDDVSDELGRQVHEVYIEANVLTGSAASSLGFGFSDGQSVAHVSDRISVFLDQGRGVFF